MNIGEEKQKEFVNLPERTPLGLKAIEYLDQRTKIENYQGILETMKGELIAEFLKSGKEHVKVNGRIVSYRHVEKDCVSVRDI